jgi:hypothetical protein
MEPPLTRHINNNGEHLFFDFLQDLCGTAEPVFQSTAVTTVSAF